MNLLRKAARMLRPWPSRSQRREAIASAAAEKELSRAGAASAAAIGHDIRRMAAENHFADQIRRSLTEGRGGAP